MINLDEGQMIAGKDLLVYLSLRGQLKRNDAICIGSSTEVIKDIYIEDRVLETFRKKQGKMRLKKYILQNNGELVESERKISTQNIFLKKWEQRYNEATNQK